MSTSDNKPIHILQVFGAMGLGGVSTWLLHIFRHLDRQRYRVDFLVYTEDTGILDAEAQALGAKIISCPHLSHPRAFARHFKRILRRHGPYDVVHGNSGYLNGFILRLAHQVQVPVRICHSHMVLSPLDPKPNLYRRLYLALMGRWINRYMTKGLAGSREAAADLYGPDWEADPRVQVLNYSVDFAAFHAEVDRVAVRTELNIPEEALVVGHVGRFAKVKNHAFMVDIAAELARRHPKFRLLLVGDGPLMPEIRRQVQQADLADRVIFAGFRRDIPRLMLGALDVFLFPSISEGLGNARLEAQAAGLPCVVSDSTPPEGDVVKGLIQRLSLSQPASAWAEAIMAMNAGAARITQGEALSIMERSPFTISATVKEIERVYAGEG